MSAPAPLAELRQIVASLRAPDGCPWDREQSHATLRGGLLEEAYEVVAAIDAHNDGNFREELGDLLLQVVMHAQIAAETGRFDLDDVARGIGEKLIRRHPHVFAKSSAADTDAVLKQWDEIKRAEKDPAGNMSLLADIPRALPSLMRADKVQKKAARVGFDWPDTEGAMAKVREETGEVEKALAAGDAGQIEEELGDLLFAVVNLARKSRCEPELTLARATDKFIARFQKVEDRVHASGSKLEQMGLEALDRLWNEVKTIP